MHVYGHLYNLNVQWWSRIGGLHCACKYRIAGKFGEKFNLANWQGILKNAKLKVANFEIHNLNGMRPRIITFQLLIYCSPPNASVNVMASHTTLQFMHFHFSERSYYETFTRT